MTDGQRRLVEAYEQVADFLPETTTSDWDAWMRMGRIGWERHRELMNARPM